MKRGTPNHPKTHELASRLGLQAWGAVGILESLWHFAGTYARRGDLGRHMNQAIARALDWHGEADQLIEALVACGWVDPCPCHRLRIHDWPEHTDQAVSRTKEVQARGWLECYSSPTSEPLEGDEQKADGAPPTIDAVPPTFSADVGDAGLAGAGAVPVPEPEPVPSGRGAPPVGDEQRPRRQEVLELVTRLALYQLRLGTRTVNGHATQGRAPTQSERQAWLDALEDGRTMESLMGSISERVRDELVTAGHLARDAPWPPPGMAPYDPSLPDHPPPGRAGPLKHAVQHGRWKR